MVVRSSLVVSVVFLYIVPPSLLAPHARLADGYFFILRVINSHTYLVAPYTRRIEKYHVPPSPIVPDIFASSS